MGAKELPGFRVRPLASGEGWGMWHGGLCSAFSAQSFTVAPVFGSMSVPGLAESHSGQCLGQQRSEIVWEKWL